MGLEVSPASRRYDVCAQRSNDLATADSTVIEFARMETANRRGGCMLPFTWID
jgi:hypothetical protein